MHLQNQVREPKFRTWAYQNQERTEIQNKGVSKISNHIQTKIKMTNPSHQLPESPKAPNKDLEDMDVLSTFKIKIESKFGACVYQRPVTI